MAVNASAPGVRQNAMNVERRSFMLMIIVALTMRISVVE